MPTEIHPIISKGAARQGETRGHMRLVLVASTGLAIVVLGGIYFWFMMQGH